jgi:integrase
MESIPRKQRDQKGGLRLRSGWFLIQFYKTILVDGVPIRKRVSKKLVKETKGVYEFEHRRGGGVEPSGALKLKMQEFMKKVNTGEGLEEDRQREHGPSPITDFWDAVYLPYIKENLRHSTVKSYEKLWELRLKNHFAEGRYAFPNYRTSYGTAYLTELKKKLGKRSLDHVRSLMSGIFTHAINLGNYGIESNPIHNLKILGKVRQPEDTEFYSLEEAEDIVSALVDRVDAQLMFSLGFFLGLRPSEIRGLKWSDVDEDFLHLRRGVVMGKVGELKTKDSARSVPLIQPVRGLIGLWRQKSGNPSDGFIFSNGEKNPIDLYKFAEKVIVKKLEEKQKELRAKALEHEAQKLRWKSFHAARRGAATVLTHLTESPRAAAQLLGHRSMAVTMAHYDKQDRAALLAGMKLLEAEVVKRSAG